MSWSDDIRCLYCDGRLPLYRKITHGQFCSSAHRKAYWQEQERLAVERLHQTHDSLKVRALPNPLKPVPLPRPLGPTPLSATALVLVRTKPASLAAMEPPSAGLLKAALAAKTGSTASLVATDPFEYEVETASRGLEWSQQRDHYRPWPLAERILDQMLPAPSAPLRNARWADSAVCAGVPEILRPRAVRPGLAPRPAGPVPAPLEKWTARLDQPGPIRVLITERTTTPAAAPMGEPRSAALTVSPASEALERMIDQLPHPDRLYRLERPGLAGPAVPPAPAAQACALAAEAGSIQGNLRLGRQAPALAAIGRVLLALRQTKAAHEIAGATAEPLPCAGPASVATVSSWLPAASEHRLPLAHGSRYMVKPRSAPDQAVAGAHQLSFADRARRAEIPALLLDLADASAGWSVPAHKIPFGQAAYRLPQSSTPLPVLALPLPLRTPAILPASRLEPVQEKSAIELVMPPAVVAAPLASSPGPDSAPAPESRLAPRAAFPAQDAGMDAWWSPAAGFWKHAPRDLKMLLFALPVMIGLALHPGLPKVRLTSAHPTEGLTQAVETQLASFRQSMAERAAVALDEDFRRGLDDWNSRGEKATEWSYDAAGFVKPGALALYSPSQGLADYQMQFLGTIGKKSLSWVVRAADFDNYYVIKLVERKGGPLPEIGVIRYAVVNGKAVDRVDTPVPISARPEMLYLVRVDVRGNDFALWVQDQIADSWTEPRLRHGGVGFYSARGEESRLRWVQITHQYDMLGRLCAYLAPYNISSN